MNGTILLMMLIIELPLLLILFFVMRSNVKPKKNIILGVTIPYEHKNDTEVQQIGRGYLRAVNITVLGLLLLSLFSLIPQSFSVGMLILMIVVTLTIVLEAVPQIVYHRKLRALKREKGWYGSQNTVVDMKNAGENQRLYNVGWFIIPLAVAAVPLVAAWIRGGGFTDTLLYLVNVLCILLFAGMYLLMRRQRSETVSENDSLNAALTRIRRRSWTVSWLAFSAFTALFSLGLWCFGQSSTGMLILMMVFCVGIIAIAMYTEMKIRRMQYKLTETKTGQVLVDEDDQWILGMIYYNPHDRHVMKNERVGMGMTMNMARVSGKLVMGLSGLIILLLPLTGVWMMAEEFTPMKLTVDAGTLVSAHLREEYRIALADIRETELLEELPSASRVVGTGMETVLKGLFHVTGYGNCELCLNPQRGPYLMVRTHEKTYLFGTNDGQETRQIYDLLQSAVQMETR